MRPLRCQKSSTIRQQSPVICQKSLHHCLVTPCICVCLCVCICTRIVSFRLVLSMSFLCTRSIFGLFNSCDCFNFFTQAWCIFCDVYRTSTTILSAMSLHNTILTYRPTKLAYLTHIIYTQTLIPMARTRTNTNTPAHTHAQRSGPNSCRWRELPIWIRWILTLCACRCFKVSCTVIWHGKLTIGLIL